MMYFASSGPIYKESIPDQYCERGVEQGLLLTTLLKTWSKVDGSYRRVDKSRYLLVPLQFYLAKLCSGIQQAGHVITECETGLDLSLLKYIGTKSVDIPETFNIHNHLYKTFVNPRMNRITNGVSLDWATAEALAIGSLLHQGHDVRLSGEDVGCRTFSPRHAMLVDQNSGEMLIPLNSLVDHQGGKLEVKIILTSYRFYFFNSVEWST